MPRRAAAITQADVARAIRAVKAAGLPVVRVVVRPDGIAVETQEHPAHNEPHESRSDLAEAKPPVVL